MYRARARLTEQTRAHHLQGEMGRWREAQEIRAYCAAAGDAHPNDPATAAWIAWAQARADRLDPLSTPPALPPVPQDPSGEDLRPFMDRGFSSYGPTARW
jgi:hypothetical protein